MILSCVHDTGNYNCQFNFLWQNVLKIQCMLIKLTKDFWENMWEQINCI